MGTISLRRARRSLPRIVDSEPVTLRLMLDEQASNHLNVRHISWDEFFLKFEALSLTFVYDDDSTGYNKILQIEEQFPYR